MKNKFTLVLVALIVALTAAIAVACPAEVIEPGPETGTYYYGAEDKESLLSLYDGNKFTLVDEKETVSGTYSLQDGIIGFTKFDEKEPSLTARYNDANKTVTFSENGSSKVYLVKKYFDVTFKINENDVIVQKVLNGKTAVKPQDPVREGYDFYGWYADDKYTTPFLFEGKTIVSQGVSVYARWEKSSTQSEYVIDFDLGYDGAKIANVCTRNGKLIDVPENPTRSGCEFAGWWISDYETREKLTAKWESGREFKANTTLFAVWKESGKDMPLASVSMSGVTWSAKSGTVKVTVAYEGEQSETFEKIEKDINGSSMAVNFASMPAGDYVINVIDGENVAAVYYKNKALDRVSKFRADGTMLTFNKVANATDYYITIECGNERHNHTMLHNGNSATYNFANCLMVDGGIAFTVTATAKGYASSVSEVFVCERKLADISGMQYDATTGYVTWDDVEGARGYVVGIDGETKSITTNKYPLKGFGIGEINLEVYAVAKGYASSSVASIKVNKTNLASPSNLKVEKYELTFDAVQGAKEYIVKVSGREYSVTTNKFSFENVNLNALTEYSISVKAVGESAATDSAWSDELDARYLQLANSLNYNENRISWAAVLGGAYYEVRVNGGRAIRVTGDIGIAVTLTKSGINEISVRFYDGSRWSEYVSIDVTAYMIMLDSRTGSETESIYAAVGDKVTLPTPQKDGYDFGGWYNTYNGANGNGAKYEDIVFSDTCDIVLYADWTAKTYDISLFDQADQSIGTTKVTYNKDFYIAPVEGEQGTFFAGWFTGKNGAGLKVTDSEGYSIDPWSLTDTNKLYAHFESDVLTYTLREDGTYEVKKGANIDKFTSVTVPETYNGAKVSVISARAFYNTDVREINIPDTIEIIEVGTAFNYIYDLEAVNIYETGHAVAPKYSSHEGVLYTNDVAGLELSFCPRAKKGEYEIKDGTDIIQVNAFYYVRELTLVTVPSSVSVIMQRAFMGCSNLECVTILDGGESQSDGLRIYSHAFYGLNKLNTVNLPSRLTEFKNDIFNGCYKLANVNINRGAAYSSVNGFVTNGGEDTVLYCPMGKSGIVRVPAGITTIGAEAFKGCNYITGVSISYTVTSIQNGAFSLCNILKTVTFEGSPSAVGTTIGEQAFFRCYILKNVNFEQYSAVVSIGKEAFGYCIALEKITVPASAKTVSDNAYIGCKNVTDVEIQEGCVDVDIAPDAFAECTRIARVIIPSTLEVLPADAINACSNVSGVIIASGNPHFSSDGVTVYNANKTAIYFYPKNFAPEGGEYSFIDTVVEIKGGVFRNNGKITVINVNKNIETIGDYAFAEMSALSSVNFEEGSKPLTLGKGILRNSAISSVTLPSRIESISEEMFAYSALTSVHVSKTVKTVGKNAFIGCNALVELVFEEDSMLENIEESAFENIAAATVTLPKTVKTIGVRAFAKSTTTEIIFEEGSVLTSIGESAFIASKLKTITLPSTVTTIGKAAFKEAKSLITADLSNAFITEIPVEAFMICTSLKSFVVPETVTVIDEKAFYGCTKLSAVTYRTGGEKDLVIGRTSFYLCAKLEAATLPSRTAKIDVSAFYYSGIKSATFTDKEIGGTDETSRLKSIADSAFQFTKLTAVELPEGLITIGENAFYKNTSLVSVVLPSTLTNLDASTLGLGHKAFANCPKLTTVEFRALAGDKPEGYIGLTLYGTFKGDTSLTSIVLPGYLVDAKEDGETVSAISALAFLGCDSLANISINASPNYIVEDNILYETNNGVKEKVILAARTKSGEVVIPHTVTDIYAMAFDGCKLITKVTFESTPSGKSEVPLKISCYPVALDSVTENDDIGTFKNTTFQEIELPARTVRLGDRAFYKSALKSITVPSSVRDDDKELGIGESCFEGSAITAVIFEENAEAKPLSIGYGAFKGCAIESVALPNGISYLGMNSFSECNSLKEVNIPSSILHIEENAFSYCAVLSKVTFGDNTKLDYIGASVFQSTPMLIEFKLPYAKQYCKVTGFSVFGTASAIKKLTIAKEIDAVKNQMFGEALVNCQEFLVEDGNRAFVAEDGVLYTKDKKILVMYPAAKADAKFAVPDGVEQIGGLNVSKVTYLVGGFYQATALTEVSIPASVTVIGENAFNGCENLTKVDFVNDGSFASELVINKNAFENCNLLSLVIPARVASNGGLGAGCFSRNRNLTSVTFENGCKITSLPDDVFNYCIKLTSINLPSTVTTIGKNAFIYCESLTSVIIAEGGKITEIGESAFKKTKISVSNISNLIKNVVSVSESVYQDIDMTVDEDGTLIIPEGVSTIGSFAFLRNKAIKKVLLPSTLLSIGRYAFGDCVGLTEVVIPVSVTELADRAFTGCTSLKKAVIPASVVTLGTGVFGSCTSLEEVVVGCYVGSYMFSDCTSLTKITLENTVTSIYRNAFAGCTSLVNVVLPASLTNINERQAVGEYAFQKCTKLQSVVFEENVSQITIGNDAFAGCTQLSEVVFPGNLVNINANLGNTFVAIGARAFDGCSKLTSLNNIQVLEGIGDYAFRNTGLTSVFVPATLSVLGSAPFYGCKIEDIELESGSTEFVQKDGAIYDVAMTTLIMYPLGFEGDVVIPETVTELNSGVFAGSRISSITLPNALRNVADQSFKGCTNLKSVISDGGITSVGKEAFAGCESLSTITLAGSLSKISEAAFSGSGIESITIGVNVAEIAMNAFNGCEKLTSVNFEKRGTKSLKIRHSAFKDCTKLASLELPWRLRDDAETKTYMKPNPPHFPITALVTDPAVGKYAFSGCTSLEKVTLETKYSESLYKGMTYDSMAFSGCASLKSVELSPYIKSSSVPFIANYPGIGNNMFENCVALKEVIIPESEGGTFNVGEYAFKGCIALEQISIPNGCIGIEKQVFAGCTSLKNVNIADSVTTIATQAFLNCTNLQTVTLPTGCDTIANSLFEGCASIKNLTLPANVTKIDAYGFKGAGIKTIVIPSTVTTIAGYAFDGWTADQTIIMEGRTEAPSLWPSTWNANCNANIVWDSAE